MGNSFYGQQKSSESVSKGEKRNESAGRNEEDFKIR